MSQTEPVQESNSPATLTSDKKGIQEEELEKILNVENEQKNANDPNLEKKPKEIKEGMEVKPKKIPIGGIQMPGFFTRSKSKEHCKEEDQIEGTELIEQDKGNKEEPRTQPNPPVQSRIRLPNPFKKTFIGFNKSEDGDKTTDSKDRLKLLQTIRMPLMSVFQRMKRTSESQNLTSQSPAGLASVETLDDKNHDEKGNNELKSIPLDDSKDVEKQGQPEFHLSQKLKDYKIAIGGLVLFLFIVIIIIVCATRGNAKSLLTPPLRDGRYIETVTSCGKVEGKMEDSSFAFRGIPYARPPVGDLRFKPAQPLNQMSYCWNGTLLAHNATPLCIQVLGNGTVTGIEDCLTLDIVTPYVRYDNPLPVIVLIGADSFMGGSPGKMRPSARYARSRDVVFVRPNFRLGVLGFLSLDLLSNSDYPPTSGNYGLSDILQALWWIKLNIEHFGGDKNSITLFGHKAGATMVTALSTMHDAKRYFTRAWAASGGSVYPNKTRSESEMDFRSYLQQIECKDVECLRKMDAKKLITSVQHTWRKPQPDLPNKDEIPTIRHQWLVADGVILREFPSDVWTREPLPVDLVIGSAAQAGSSDLLRLKHTNWTEGLVKQHVNTSYIGAKNLMEESLKRYPATYRGLSSMVTDIRIVCPLFLMWTQMHNVTFYVVNQTRGDFRLADIDSDVDAILGRYEPKTTEQRRYFSAMQSLFYHFVWHGKIDQKFSGKNVLIVDQDVLPNSTYESCDFWTWNTVVPQFAALD